MATLGLMDDYAAQQLQVLEDLRQGLALVMEKLPAIQDDGNTNSKQVVTVLGEIKAALEAISAVETPETPDFAKPIIEALTGLQNSLGAAIKGIEVNPTTPDVHVDAPVVKVAAPVVDLSGVEKALKTLPGAFDQAISKIPETPPTDLSVVIDGLNQLQETLGEINIGVRLKPLPASSMKVSNMDGSTISPGLVTKAYDYVAISSYDTNNNPLVVNYYSGGAIGTRVATLTLTYDTSFNLLTVTKT